MARRRRKSIPEPKTALLSEQTSAVRKALGVLHKRTLYHLVSPKYAMPRLHEVARSLVDDEIWDLMARSRDITRTPVYGESYFRSHIAIDMADSALEVALEVNSDWLLPKDEHWRLAELVNYPVLNEYAQAAKTCYDNWQRVADIFKLLNDGAKRSTLGFYWPCVTALLKMGGQPDDTLNNIERPMPLRADLVSQVRETNAFVMQHMMLPKVDSGVTTGYDGDSGTGLAAYLKLNSISDAFGSTIWPIVAE